MRLPPLPAAVCRRRLHSRRRFKPPTTRLPARRPPGWLLLFQLALKKLPPVQEALGLKCVQLLWGRSASWVSNFVCLPSTPADAALYCWPARSLPYHRRKRDKPTLAEMRPEIEALKVRVKGG